jgi:hypothetical protein
MEKITIKEIQRINKHSDKKDKDYVSVVIVDEQGRKMSGFSDETNKNWKVGQEVEVELEKKGGYLNFRSPRKYDEFPAERIKNPVEEVIGKLAKKIVELEKRVKELEDINKRPKYIAEGDDRYNDIDSLS